MASVALVGTASVAGGIRDRVASFIKEAPDRQTKDLLRDVLTALDQPFSLAWAKDEYRLSPAEFRVLELLVQGRPAGSIGDLLGIQVSTVRVHIYKLYRKMGVSNMTELTALLLQRAKFL